MVLPVPVYVQSKAGHQLFWTAVHPVSCLVFNPALSLTLLLLLLPVRAAASSCS
jgi:hypothetical protein